MWLVYCLKQHALGQGEATTEPRAIPSFLGPNPWQNGGGMVGSHTPSAKPPVVISHWCRICYCCSGPLSPTHGVLCHYSIRGDVRASWCVLPGAHSLVSLQHPR